MEHAQSSSLITVGLARDPQDRDAVLAFIDEVARKWHNCTAPPPPQLLFYARQDDRIVGTVSLDFGDKAGILPIEDTYLFPHPAFFTRTRNRVAQCGRWMATIPGISRALLFAEVLYALHHGKVYGISEVKTGAVADRFATLGVELHFIKNAKLLLDRVPESARGYYVDLPLPEPCLVRFQQMYDGLRALTREECREYHIVFDESIPQ